jgi:hypothetical protein
MAKLKLTPSRPKLKGWPFVVIAGLVLAALAVVDSGEFTLSACQLRVTAATADVHTGPSAKGAPVQTLDKGATVDGTTVISQGFRQLGENRWISTDQVTPTSLTTCR